MTTQLAHPANGDSSTAGELLAAVRFGVPGAVNAHVPRPRLLQTLRGADAVPLVLVSGPAGAGKTTLVADWVRRREGDDDATGWISFEDGDTAFWEYVVECLVRLGIELPDDVSGFRGDGVLGIQRLAVLAAAVAEVPRRLILVLDGYELVAAELAHEVDFLLRHTLGRLCLVFVGRTDPVLPLYRYRLDDNLHEIRAADLAFTDEEAAQLLASTSVALDRDCVHDLNRRVKGWAAGLRFAARALAGRPHPERFVATVVAQTGDINEYLMGEVLDAQPPEVRRFLLDTCVPDLLCADLVEELTGPRGARTLEDVARSNAFIELVPEQPDHYRYYPFFRELLRAQLAYESPDRMADLHRRTAEWLRRSGLPEQAVTHLAAISAWQELAGHLVESALVGRLLLGQDDDPLVMVAVNVPGGLDVCAAHVVRAAVLLRQGERAGCAQELAAARRTAGSEDQAGLLAIEVLDAARACTADSAGAAGAAAERAQQALVKATPVVGTPELQALVLRSAGAAALRQGDLRRARKAFTTASAPDVSGRFPAFRADCLGHVAVVDALEGHLTRARRTATESMAVADEAGVAPADQSPAAAVALACTAMEQYELRTAREHVASALACRSIAGDPVCRALVETVMAGLERAGGHLQPALARLDAAAARVASEDPWLADRLRVEAAKLSVASARAEQALEELEGVQRREEPEPSVVTAAAYAEKGEQAAAEEWLSVARSGQAPMSTAVAALLVEVVQESRRRAPGRARVALERSLRQAAHEELRRPFREAGPSVQRLLAADPGLLREHPWLNHSARAAGEPDSHRRPVGTGAPPATRVEVVETLTPKELEVLGHLEELLSTDEIAEKMFVSVNTVRTHVRSILRKLGVSRRNAAVRRARDLDLFDR